MKHTLTMIATTMVGIANAATIQISVTGTANNSKWGYESGLAYTFHWVINEAYENNTPPNGFSSTVNNWGENLLGDSMIFSSISGDGLTGTLIQPSDPYSNILMFDFGSPFDDLRLNASSDSGSNGIQVYGEGLRALGASYLYIDDLEFTGTYIDPTAYFSNHIGSYAPEAGGQIELWGTSSGILYFTATNVTIIPEASSAMTMLVIGAGGCFFRKRLRR